MGFGAWIKTSITLKKAKQNQARQAENSSVVRPNGLKVKNRCHKGLNSLHKAASSVNPEDGIALEDIAAIRIQSAFRRFKARKTLRSLKGLKRLHALGETHPIKKQASTALSYIQTWTRMQSQIRARRACMVAEGHIKQKKQDNQLKLESKLHDIEVEWCGGSETMEEILARIHQREEAAIKRERAMAYAFSHQWRANSSLNHGQPAFDVGKGNWGWSWMERWIAARPWETRLPSHSVCPNKGHKKAVSEGIKSANSALLVLPRSGKPPSSNKKNSTTNQSESSDEKTVNQGPNHKLVALNSKSKKYGKLKQSERSPLQPSDNIV